VAALNSGRPFLVTRALQVRVRRAERETELAIGAVNTRLQEDLRGIEVIRGLRSRAGAHRGLPAGAQAGPRHVQPVVVLFYRLHAGRRLSPPSPWPC
jgi:hypothetical protein